MTPSPPLFTTLTRRATTAPPRLSTGFAGFDRAAGGGFPPSTTFLLAGDPGAGKSTLLLQTAARIALRDGPDAAVYVTGEETADAIQALAARLNISTAPVRLAAVSNIVVVLDVLVKAPPRFLVVDSVQRMSAQPRLVLDALVTFAHATAATIAVVCHVTKDRRAAGPNELQHDVDAVFYFEAANAYRLLHPTKNRFGPTTRETFGIFVMTPTGLVE
jgi:DNA repair protein RadA/Sms